MGELTTFAWEMWFASWMTTNTACSRSRLPLVQSSSNSPIIQPSEVFCGPLHNSSSALPAWSISPLRLPHNPSLPMTLWLTIASTIVVQSRWTLTIKVALAVLGPFTCLLLLSLWDTNFKKESILKTRKQQTNIRKT